MALELCLTRIYFQRIFPILNLVDDEDVEQHVPSDMVM
jgi:hypothetical protein